MKPPPSGWPRLSASVFYDDAPAAIAWLVRAFGFEVRLKVEGDEGRIEYSELAFGEALVMVSSLAQDASAEPWRLRFASPRSLQGRQTQSLCLYVDDVDAICAHAAAAGATVARAPSTTDYGDDYWSDRSCGLLDLEGHLWWFMQRVRGPTNAR
jgi:uncharacterized glyoxalase superfamily protein PhnB